MTNFTAHFEFGNNFSAVNVLDLNKGFQLYIDDPKYK